MVDTEKKDALIQFTKDEIWILWTCFVIGPKDTARWYDFDEIFAKEEQKKKILPFVIKDEKWRVTWFKSGAVELTTDEKSKFRSWIHEIKRGDADGIHPVTTYKKLG